MFVTYLWQGLALGGAAAAQPGPLQVYLLSQTLRNGGWRTLPAAFAPLVSDGPIIALTLLLLTQMPDWLVLVLRLGGGLFLLYLAWGAWLSFRGSETVTAVSTPTESTQSVLKVALMNALSPNPYIYWATITGPILLEGWRESAVSGVAFLLGFYVTLIGGFAGFILLFALTGKLDKQVTRVLSLLSAIALLGFGLYQLWLGGTAVFLTASS